MIAAVAMLSSLTVLDGATSRAEASQQALARGESAAAVALPVILSPADRDRYRRIFEFQRLGKWPQADREIAKLGDDLLIGHVQAQRYLHPTRYRSRYRELSRWLRHHADLPDARQIYRLALKRRSKKSGYPRPPKTSGAAAQGTVTLIEHSGYRPGRGSARRHIATVRRMVNRRQLTAAEKYIGSRKVRQSLGATGQELARTLIASGWFFYGDGAKALTLAERATAAAGARLPYAHWIAGLAAYRLERYATAAEHFEAVAASGLVRGWDHAAAAFWAARANMIGQRPDRVNRWLEEAARQPRSFYGILARRWQGVASPFNWTPPTLTEERLAELVSRKAGRRALALIEIGEDDRANRELRNLARPGNTVLAEALIALAELRSLPAVAMRAGASVSSNSARFPASGLYPLPAWAPDEGFRVDRALIFAFMRQESAFKIKARSHAGARGLMQLMPATAGFIAQRRFTGKRRNLLYDPALNMSLGQKYILHLLENDIVGGDLLLLAAAYNGGPGNLSKWHRRASRHQYTDALMFIESIPARETRIFIERVLANLWMYRERLGQPAPSLDALAAGERPIYIAVEGANGSVAEDVRN